MEYFDKTSFNKCNIKKQVDIFNELLKDSKNIKEACNKLHISYSTIRERFAKNEYVYNKYSHKYEKANNYNNEELEHNINLLVDNVNNSNYIDDNNKIVVRSFRIYDNILNDFILYCENSKMKQYDILALFLMEGMNKYKKSMM